MASYRREIHIERAPDDVWELVGDPARLHDWFPIDNCVVEGNIRWIYLASGLKFEEEILVHDNAMRRFQYTIINNQLWKGHLGTIDVIDDQRGGSFLIYSTQGKPDVLALVTEGAAGAGMKKAKQMLEAKK